MAIILRRGPYWGGDVPDVINLHPSPCFRSWFVERKRGLGCRLMTSGTLPPVRPSSEDNRQYWEKSIGLEQKIIKSYPGTQSPVDNEIRINAPKWISVYANANNLKGIRPIFLCLWPWWHCAEIIHRRVTLFTPGAYTLCDIFFDDFIMLYKVVSIFHIKPGHILYRKPGVTRWRCTGVTFRMYSSQTRKKSDDTSILCKLPYRDVFVCIQIDTYIIHYD